MALFSDVSEVLGLQLSNGTALCKHQIWENFLAGNYSLHNLKPSNPRFLNSTQGPICNRIYSSCLYWDESPNMQRITQLSGRPPLIFMVVLNIWSILGKFLQRFKQPHSLLQAGMNSVSSRFKSTGSHSDVLAHCWAQADIFSKGLLALPLDNSFT